MIVLNFFKLLYIKTYDIYKWFIEIVSLDSYDIFMVGNISGIIFNRDYISSSNYLMKMSDFTFTNEEKDLFDALYFRRLKDSDILVPYKEN